MDFSGPKVNFLLIHLTELKNIYLVFVSNIPLGKYSANNCPDDDSNNVVNGSVLPATGNANKQLDEITPLLHQASISSPNSLEQDDETNANMGSGNNCSGALKTNNRRRVRRKYSRKIA